MSKKQFDTPNSEKFFQLLQSVFCLSDKVGKVGVVEARGLIRCARIEEAAVEAFVLIHAVGASGTIRSVFREATVGIVELNYRRRLHESAVSVERCTLV